MPSQKRHFPLIRLLLGGCLCLFVGAPDAVQAQGPRKAFSEAAMRWLRSLVRPVDENISRRADTELAREASRSAKAKEAIRKLQVQQEDELSILWDVMDDATKKRARLRASELERFLEEQAERIKEEEKLRKECGTALASVLIKTACFCVKEKARTGSWPTEEASTRFATGATGAAVECLSGRLAHQISQVARAGVAKYAAPTTEALGKAIGKASEAGETSESESTGGADPGLLFGLAYELCKHE